MIDAVALFTVLCWAQGMYYLVTGVWPLLSIRSFQAVTGRKTDNWTGREGDHWLVYTVAVLILAVAATLIVAAVHGGPSLEVVVLALASIVALTAIDSVFVARRVISPIYLLDAVVEIGLLIAWAMFLTMW